MQTVLKGQSWRYFIFCLSTNSKKIKNKLIILTCKPDILILLDLHYRPETIQMQKDNVKTTSCDFTGCNVAWRINPQ